MSYFKSRYLNFVVDSSNYFYLYNCCIYRNKTIQLIKNRLKTLRAENNFTQSYLAIKLEVSKHTRNALEKGTFYPSLPLAFKISKLFNLPIEEIFQVEKRKKKVLTWFKALNQSITTYSTNLTRYRCYLKKE